MPRKKLTIEQQIKVLKDAKEIINSGNYGMCCYGMCTCIEISLRQYNINTYHYINCYIPTFTLNHICKITKNTELYPTLMEKDWFWWKLYDNVVRSKVFDLLIKELEDKLKEI